MNKFAKLFESDLYGQICVLSLDINEEEFPEVRCYFSPDHDLYSVCAFSVMFEPSDKGTKSRDQYFNEIDLEEIESVITKCEKATLETSSFH